MIGRVRRLLVAGRHEPAPPRARLARRGARDCWRCPTPAYAWTPGTHIYLGQTMLANLHLLPAAVADLLHAYPFDFLYGNIAADSSIAKNYAPLGRHCHYWHVGQEIHDLAGSDALRAFGLGYLCHLAADTVAHNYFVPRQLVLTSSTAAVGHSYWESRVETPPGRRLRPLGEGHHPAGPRSRPTRTSIGSSRRRSSACAPTGGCSGAWCTSPRRRAGSEGCRRRGTGVAGT